MDALEAKLTNAGSPFELRETLIRGIPCKVFARGPQTLNAIYRKASSSPNCEYLVYGSERLSLAHTLQRAEALARALERRVGIAEKTRVAIVMRNCPDWVISFIAITAIGATAVLIHAAASEADIALSIRRTECYYVVADLEHARMLLGIPLAAVIVANVREPGPALDTWLSLSALIEWGMGNRAGVPYNHLELDPETTALIAFSSGTTGEPKAFLASHRNVVTGLMNMMLGGVIANRRGRSAGGDGGKTVPQSGPPCTLVLAPFSYIAGYAQLLLMMWVSGKVICIDHWETANVLAAISGEKVRSLAGTTPTHLWDLLRAARSDCDVRSLSSFHVHGASLRTNLVAELEREFPNALVTTGYGLTETCGSICIAAGGELSERRGSSGRVLPSTDIRLINHAGADVSPDELGQVLVRGAMTASPLGLSRDGAVSAASDGWLPTGDIGRLDSDGYLYIVNRVSDVILVSGREVSSSDVEREVFGQPAIQEAVVLGMYCSEDREHLLLALTLRQRCRLDTAALRSHLQRQLDWQELSLKVLECERFPRTHSGKIDRKYLYQALVERINSSELPGSLSFTESRSSAKRST